MTSHDTGGSVGGVIGGVERAPHISAAAQRLTAVHSGQCPETGLQGPVPVHLVEWTGDTPQPVVVLHRTLLYHHSSLGIIVIPHVK